MYMIMYGHIGLRRNIAGFVGPIGTWMVDDLVPVGACIITSCPSSLPFMHLDH